MSIIYNLTSLITDGYAVVQNMLDDDDINRLIEVYANKKIEFVNGVPNKNYNLLPGGNHLLEDKISNLLKQINIQANLHIDLIMKNCNFFDTELTSFGWHCDHERFYRWRYNSLNIWIPIIKPSSTELGLAIVPHSKLLEVSPEITKKHIIGGGAKTFSEVNNTTTKMADDDYGINHILNVDFSTLEIIPEVSVGDAIIMKNDCIHRTQNSDGHRVAVSIMCLNSNGVVHKDDYIVGCQKKLLMMKNGDTGYQKVLSKFGSSNSIKLGTIYPNASLVDLSNV